MALLESVRIAIIPLAVYKHYLKRNERESMM